MSRVLRLSVDGGGAPETYEWRLGGGVPEIFG